MGGGVIVGWRVDRGVEGAASRSGEGVGGWGEGWGVVEVLCGGGCWGGCEWRVGCGWEVWVGECGMEGGIWGVGGVGGEGVGMVGESEGGWGRWGGGRWGEGGWGLWGGLWGGGGVLGWVGV
uniref:Uncharacterized protein n=1 Tax=Knipowitschia caucasica TaxID=637954 RepID=A0AAV2LVY9_KNICA